MAFNISEISSTINGKGGLMKPSKFYATITRPLTLGNSDERTLPFLCEATQLPGVSLTLETVRPFTYGVEEKRPNNVNFQDIALTFYADNSGTVFNYFHQWIHFITEFSDRNSMNRYLMEYPTNYRGTINLYVLDEAQNQVLTYTLYDAFPFNVDPIPVSWDASDQIVRFNATFTFTNWTSSTLQNVNQAHQYNIETYTAPSLQTINTYPAYSYNYNNPVLNPFYIASNPILQTASAVANIVNVFSRLF